MMKMKYGTFCEILTATLLCLNLSLEKLLTKKLSYTIHALIQTTETIVNNHFEFEHVHTADS